MRCAPWLRIRSGSSLCHGRLDRALASGSVFQAVDPQPALSSADDGSDQLRVACIQPTGLESGRAQDTSLPGLLSGEHTTSVSADTKAALAKPTTAKRKPGQKALHLLARLSAGLACRLHK